MNKEEFINSLDDGTVDESILTVGRLIKSLLNYRVNIPIKLINCTSQSNEMQIISLGASYDDEAAWAGEIELPKNANVFEILAINKN